MPISHLMLSKRLINEDYLIILGFPLAVKTLIKSSLQEDLDQKTKIMNS
jgi:hypothetical protein